MCSCIWLPSKLKGLACCSTRLPPLTLEVRIRSELHLQTRVPAACKLRLCFVHFLQHCLRGCLSARLVEALSSTAGLAEDDYSP